MEGADNGEVTRLWRCDQIAEKCQIMERWPDTWGDQIAESAADGRGDQIYEEMIRLWRVHCTASTTTEPSTLAVQIMDSATHYHYHLPVIWTFGLSPNADQTMKVLHNCGFVFLIERCKNSNSILFRKNFAKFQRKKNILFLISFENSQIFSF